MAAIRYEYYSHPEIFIAEIWHPQGCDWFIIRSGGLRGLGPPATLFATLRVACLINLTEVSEHMNSQIRKLSTD